MNRQIVLSRYRVTLEAVEPLNLPAYLGSTLRGAFGEAFKRLACPARTNEPCPIPETCPFELIFNTKLPPDPPAISPGLPSTSLWRTTGPLRRSSLRERAPP